MRCVVQCHVWAEDPSAETLDLQQLGRDCPSLPLLPFDQGQVDARRPEARYAHQALKGSVGQGGLRGVVGVKEQLQQRRVLNRTAPRPRHLRATTATIITQPTCTLTKTLASLVMPYTLQLSAEVQCLCGLHP